MGFDGEGAPFGDSLGARRGSTGLAVKLGAHFGAMLVALVCLAAGDARAEPSVWSSAREPDAWRESEASRAAEALVLRYRQIRRGRSILTDDLFGDVERMAKLYLEDARSVLVSSGAARSANPAHRLQLAEVLYELQAWDEAAALYATIVGDETPAPIRAEAWKALAICYARLGRSKEEIHAYDAALALEPHESDRALLLANQAEAYMLGGDLDAAVSGYRAALFTLRGLTPYEIARASPTTYWGLAVALDRSGDIEGAFASIRLARSYDPADRLLNSPGWFYVPEYDVAWYAALGYWAAARAATVPAARAEAYLRAVTSWGEYLRMAAPADRWLPIARARLAQCEAEQKAAARRAARH